MRTLAALLVTGWPLVAQPALTADQIMAQVAEQQAKAEAARSQYVYRQQTLVRMVRPGGKIAREERREYTVTPQPTETKKVLISLAGQYEQGGKLYPYSNKEFRYKGVDVDGELVEHLSDGLMHEKKARDGINVDLFPLRAEEQKNYLFTLKGTTNAGGREAYRIDFKPRPKAEAAWAGEAWIDAKEFQPVRVTTKLAHNIPLVVRTMLGTNVKQIGFTVAYDRISEGIWFPVSYGTEFGLTAVFFYRRTITMSLKSSEFRKTDSASAIRYELPESAINEPSATPAPPSAASSSLPPP